MFATNLLISTQNRLQNTIRVIVLVETFASTWLYKQYYIYHWPRPLGPSADPNYEALSLVMTVPLAIWLNLLRASAVCGNGSGAFARRFWHSQFSFRSREAGCSR